MATTHTLTYSARAYVWQQNQAYKYCPSFSSHSSIFAFSSVTTWKIPETIILIGPFFFY